MHELGLIENIFQVITKTAGEHNLTRVTRVNLRVGSLRQVIPSSMEWAFRVVTEGTIAEGAVLSMEIVPVRVRCTECGNVEKVQEQVYACSRCMSRKVEITAGKELIILSIEGDSDGNQSDAAGS
jgi:hydrogenase nickel incorporation protein HypA/HybF